MKAPDPAAGPWVRVDIVDASVSVAVEDVVAALWLAAEHGDISPADVRLSPPGAGAFRDWVQAVVLGLLTSDHAGILATRARLAALPPDTHLHQLVVWMRGWAAELFDAPVGLAVPDNLADLDRHGGMDGGMDGGADGGAGGGA